ncbi:hypothetical protein [Streptomyces sp. NPDC008001]|uniref:hypothetical protein n=1 Tax=Streptomyces sp. NPDC008001 TaxID=3364804 RepID=UPI0036EEB9B6
MTAAPATAHPGGSPVRPTQEECPLCTRYRSAVNAAIGRTQWAGVQSDKEGLRRALSEEAEYRAGWAGHLASTLTGRAPDGTACAPRDEWSPAMGGKDEVNGYDVFEEEIVTASEPDQDQDQQEGDDD